MTKEERQLKKRDMILNDKMLKTILYIALPIVFIIYVIIFMEYMI